MLRRLAYSLARKTFLKRRLRLIELKKERYNNIISPQKIHEYQIKMLNKVWKYCINNIPFYIEWRRLHNLPERIDSIEDLRKFPILTKEHIHENQELILSGLKNYYLTSTGGTSGITTHFPTSKENADEAYANAYLGRSWWQIYPLDDILMFWGHSHLFGKGFGRLLKQFKRQLVDFLINTRRISCYSLDADEVALFYKAVVSENPVAIISYSSNMFKICQYMKSRNLRYFNPKIRGVILTSETVSKADIELVNQYMNTSVINEYGMAETGSIAYSYQNTNNIRVFWDSFILTKSQRSELILTTIGSSIFPLINYSTEDLVEVKKEYRGSVLYLNSILGKVRDVLNIRMLDGSKKEVSTILFDHILKFYPDIYSIHYQQDGMHIMILLTSNIQLNLEDIKSYICGKTSEELLHIDPAFLSVSQIDKTEKTIAGKNQTLLTL